MNFFDLHCDTPYECYVKNQEFNKNSLAVSGEGANLFDNWAETFAVWIKDDAENPFNLYRNILKDFKIKLSDKPSNLTPIFSVEGGALLENDSDRLFTLKNDGIKFLTLTWNGENLIAGGVDSQKGLTDFGKELIEKMNRLKIACDLSHLNEKSFYSAAEKSDFPLATHSNCRAITNHKRNLTDFQLKLIAQKGGVIGICFYPPFLGEDVFEGIYRNIVHFLELGFENNISIGSDFDGAVMHKNLENIARIPFLWEFLALKGLDKTLLDKIFYKNAYNFIAKLN